MFYNCPHCGATLSTKLVERIADPQAAESCPKYAEVKHFTTTPETVDIRGLTFDAEVHA